MSLQEAISLAKKLSSRRGASSVHIAKTESGKYAVHVDGKEWSPSTPPPIPNDASPVFLVFARD